MPQSERTQEHANLISDFKDQRNDSKNGPIKRDLKWVRRGNGLWLRTRSFTTLRGIPINDPTNGDRRDGLWVNFIGKGTAEHIWGGVQHASSVERDVHLWP